MTPEMYKKFLKDSSIAEMIRARDKLIEDMKEYEDAIRKGYDVVMTPDPLTVYKNNYLCLIEVCRLICENVDGQFLDLNQWAIIVNKQR